MESFEKWAKRVDFQSIFVSLSSKKILRRTTRKLPQGAIDEVISDLYDNIKDKEIWISYGEVQKFAYSQIRKVVNVFSKRHSELARQFEEEHQQKKNRKVN